MNDVKTTVFSKGQAAIPSFLRNLLGIHAGSEVIIKVRNDGVCELEPTRRNIEMFFGRCKSRKKIKKPALSVEGMDKLILKVIKDNDKG